MELDILRHVHIIQNMAKIIPSLHSFKSNYEKLHHNKEKTEWCEFIGVKFLLTLTLLEKCSHCL